MKSRLHRARSLIRDELRQSFATNGYSVRKLIVDIAAASALPPDPKK